MIMIIGNRALCHQCMICNHSSDYQIGIPLCKNQIGLHSLQEPSVVSKKKSIEKIHNANIVWSLNCNGFADPSTTFQKYIFSRFLSWGKVFGLLLNYK